MSGELPDETSQSCPAPLQRPSNTTGFTTAEANPPAGKAPPARNAVLPAQVATFFAPWQDAARRVVVHRERVASARFFTAPLM